ncbi:MAG TPA: response regulator [Thermoanaerobaculia bacterium]|nr:response regulator [Thermoanaerobaculia bacterium]
MRNEQRILIADDDDAIRTLLLTVLRRRGFHAEEARNGIEALEKLMARRYAVVLLDLMMPRMSGYDVLDRLAVLPRSTRPLVLVLTAGLEPRPFDTSLVIGTLHKPFDIELLVDMIAGCVAAVEAQPQAIAAETLTVKPDEAS